MRRKLNIFLSRYWRSSVGIFPFSRMKGKSFFFLFFRKFILVIAKFTRVLFRASVVTNRISDIFDFHFQTGEHSV